MDTKRVSLLNGNVATAEQSIYELRKKAALFLRAGDMAEYDRILTTIANLQRTTGAVKGHRKDNTNDQH